MYKNNINFSNFAENSKVWYYYQKNKLLEEIDFLRPIILPEGH